MTQFNIIRYSGNNHTTLVADTKLNPTLISAIQATSKDPEKARQLLLEQLHQTVEGEAELTITDFKGFSKMGTEQLLKLYEKTEKMLGAHEMIEAILIKRNALSIAEPEEETPEAEEIETPETEEKTPREYKKCMSEECLQARLAEARTHYREFCKFLCTKTKTEELGIIRSARLDKRSGFIQYRIEIITLEDTVYTPTGKVFGKGDDSKDLQLLLDTGWTKKVEEPAQEELAQESENNTEVAE